MCLGAQARTANANARRQYQAAINQRESNWMQSLSVYNAKINQYKENVDNSGVAIQNAYSEAQRKKNDARARAELQYEGLYKELLETNKASDLLASGQTGRSVARLNTMELAKYGRNINALGREVLYSDREADRVAQQEAGKLIGFRKQQFTDVAFQPIADVEPPQPVMQSVGAAMFMDALSIGTSLLSIPGKGGGSLLLGLGN